MIDNLTPERFTQHLNEQFVLPGGAPHIPSIELIGASASAVILASEESDSFAYDGLAEAMAVGAPRRPVDLRLFAKPKTLKNRRMGVALARGENVEEAVERAKTAAARVRIRYGSR